MDNNKWPLLVLSEMWEGYDKLQILALKSHVYEQPPKFISSVDNVKSCAFIMNTVSVNEREPSVCPVYMQVRYVGELASALVVFAFLIKWPHDPQSCWERTRQCHACTSLRWICHGIRKHLGRLLSFYLGRNKVHSPSNWAIWSVLQHHTLNPTLAMLLTKIWRALAFG